MPLCEWHRIDRCAYWDTKLAQSRTTCDCENCMQTCPRFKLKHEKEQAQRIIKTLQVFDFSTEQLARIEEILNE